METKQNPTIHTPDGVDPLQSVVRRRQFLRYAGASAAAITLLAAGCKDDKYNDADTPGTGGGPSGSVDLGSGDFGILNYAYALEQLEAAFYTQVVLTQYSGITSAETALLTDIRDHELAHREFFKRALGTRAIGNLEVDFSKIDFSSRASVLGTAMVFEDLGVTAYDGVGFLIEDDQYLVLAGKIVSVEARHAAYIRNLLKVGDYGQSEFDASAVNKANDPTTVLTAASAFVKTKIDFSKLPK